MFHPLDCYRTSAIGIAIGEALSCLISHPYRGRSSQTPRSEPLRKLNSAIVVLYYYSVQNQISKQVRNKNTIEAAILDRVLDRDWNLNRRGPLSRRGAQWSSAARRCLCSVAHYPGVSCLSYCEGKGTLPWATNPFRPWGPDAITRKLVAIAFPLLIDRRTQKCWVLRDSVLVIGCNSWRAMCVK